MTKERRLAIQMWEFVIEHFDESDVYSLKQAFSERHPEIEWQNDCWFCEYCRRDYRNHPGRESISSRANNCQLCPLYQYEIEHGNYAMRGDACGCDRSDWHYEPLFSRAQFRQSKRAAEMILKVLKGGEKL